MRIGSHARADGSFGRSASTQTLKGAALLVVAVLIGVVLLKTAPRNITTVSTAGPRTGTTHAPKAVAPPVSATPPPTTVPPAHQPGQVHLLVANGTTVNNEGGKIRTQLNGAGYNTDKTAIDAPTKDHATTMVYFLTPTFEADALQVATTLSLQPNNVSVIPATPPVPDASLTGVDVLIVVGMDIAGQAGSQTQTGPADTSAPTQATTAQTSPPQSTPSRGTSPAPTSTSVRHPSTTVEHTATTAHAGGATTTEPAPTTVKR